MPRPTYPRDRFDDLADESGRVGAHRAENPRLRGGVVLLWAAVATVVLVVAGIFGTLVVSGRVVLFPEPEPTVAATPAVEPVVDTTYEVLILNATGQQGLATQLRDTVVASGWAADLVTASDAASEFDVTTIFYATAADEAAALGLAQVVGGAELAESTQYIQPDDAGTERDESRMLTVVLGLDRVTPAAETPAG